MSIFVRANDLRREQRSRDDHSFAPQMAESRPTPQQSSTVLVIEDNPDLAYGLRNSLEIAGYSVAVAEDGVSGVEQARAIDPDLIVPNEELSLREGAIDPWEKRNAPFFQQILDAVAGHYKIDVMQPWSKLPPEHRKIIMEGSGSDEVDFF